MKKIQNTQVRGVLLGAVLLAAISGCRWKEKSQLDQVTWSEDGTEIVYAVLHFEEGIATPGDGTTPKRNFRHELRVRNPEGTQERVLVSSRPGQNGADIYRMKCHGYSLVPVISESSYRVDLIRDSGGVQTVDTVSTQENCQSLHVIPSPHGEYLARVKTKGCLGEGEIPVTDYDIAFLLAADLSVTGHYQFVGIPSYTGFGWNADNQLVLSDGRSAKYLDVQGGGVTESPDPYSCLIPATTSSSISALGSKVQIREGQIEIVPASEEERPFACGAHKDMDMSCK